MTICARSKCGATVQQGERLCQKHFTKAFNSTKEALASQVEKTDGEDGCWLWTGVKQKSGYGIMGTFGITSNSKTAHWVAMYIASPETFNLNGHGEVHHTCKNPSCVNPAHLVHMQTSFHELLHQLSNTRVAGIVLDHFLESYPHATEQITALRSMLHRP